MVLGEGHSQQLLALPHQGIQCSELSLPRGDPGLGT